MVEWSIWIRKRYGKGNVQSFQMNGYKLQLTELEDWGETVLQMKV